MPPYQDAHLPIIKLYDSAEKYSHLAISSLTKDEFAEALINAHTRGVEVKVLIDKTQAGNQYADDERGIAKGDWVFVEAIYFGDRERIKFRVKLVAGFPKRVIAADHGWWFPELKEPKHGCFESNPNVVTPGDLYDPIYGSTNLKSIPCRIYKA